MIARTKAGKRLQEKAENEREIIEAEKDAIIESATSLAKILKATEEKADWARMADRIETAARIIEAHKEEIRRHQEAANAYEYAAIVAEAAEADANR